MNHVQIEGRYIPYHRVDCSSEPDPVLFALVGDLRMEVQTEVASSPVCSVCSDVGTGTYRFIRMTVWRGCARHFSEMDTTRAQYRFYTTGRSGPVWSR